MLLTHMYLWTNHLCMPLKHILVQLRLSLNYQNQTRTFHLSTACVVRCIRILPFGMMMPLVHCMHCPLDVIGPKTKAVIGLTFSWARIERWWPHLRCRWLASARVFDFDSVLHACNDWWAPHNVFFLFFETIMCFFSWECACFFFHLGKEWLLLPN
jgi:hypothetical protein